MEEVASKLCQNQSISLKITDGDMKEQHLETAQYVHTDKLRRTTNTG